MTGGYSELDNGLLDAKLVITSATARPETIAVDLNPIRDLALSIDTLSIEHDYSQGVMLRWNGVKYNGSTRHSDFLGYVVTRQNAADTSDTAIATLLTPWPVTAGNFYHDRFPDSGGGEFLYTVSAVDSSFNACAIDMVTVGRPAFVKTGFPVRTMALMKAPTVADFDKDGMAEVYTVGDNRRGRLLAYRTDGQEAVVREANDGIVSDSSIWESVVADIDGDGLDEVVYVTDSSLVAHDIATDAILWTVLLGGSPHLNGNIQCYRKPIIADMDGDGGLDIVLFVIDNEGGASSLAIYRGSSGDLMVRRYLGDHSYAPALAVGDFLIGNGDSLEILLAAHPQGQRSTYIYILGEWDGSGVFGHVDSAFVCSGYDSPDEAKTVIVNSALAVGNLYGDTSTLEIALSKGRDRYSGEEVKDTLMVCNVNRATGLIAKAVGDTAQAAKCRVNYLMWTIFGSSAAIADIDNDGTNEVVFATDDTLYLLRMATQDSVYCYSRLPFGRVPGNRLDGNSYTPQPLVADIDNDDSLEIVVNHQGDGTIWAFDRNGSGQWAAKRKGFPLKTAGRVARACQISDMEGDGILDLTAVDEGGRVYVWSLDSGSVYRQPWPAQFGNNWNTGYTRYRDGGNVGYLYEDWAQARVAPYSWIESGAGNALDTISAGSGVFSWSNGILSTSGTGDRNYHFMGPNMSNVKDYTVEGSFMFDSANAEFGVNFYSQWPDSADKYMFIRMSNGNMVLYSMDNGSATSLGSIAGVATNTATWYRYWVRAGEVNGDTMILAKVWADGDSAPTLPQIEYGTVAFDGGLVGAVTNGGTGSRYWGPISVTANKAAQGAYMAYETFARDTVVDVRPYTPANWSATYGSTQFPVTFDTTGFSLDTTGGEQALVYRHKPGATYPVTCKLLPYSNLEWRDYEFSGTIIKPAGAEYDSIGIGAVIYAEAPDRYYSLKVRGLGNGGNGFVLVRTVGTSDSLIDTLGDAPVFQGSVDTVLFAINIRTKSLVAGLVSYADSVIEIQGQVWEPGQSSDPWEFVDVLSDTGAKRLKGGSPALLLDNWTGAQRLELSNVKVKKTR